MHFIQIIGEAANHVSDKTKEEYPIPWTKVVGMRNRIVHDYLTTNFVVVWEVVKQELPLLVAELEKDVPSQK